MTVISSLLNKTSGSDVHCIAPSKFLSINTLNLQSLNHEANNIAILRFSCYNSKEEILNFFEQFKTENYPNVFIISIAKKDDYNCEIYEGISHKISERFESSSLLLEIDSRIFCKRANKGIFETTFDLSDNEIQNDINTSRLSIETFLNILNDTSVLEWDFCKLKKYKLSYENIYKCAINAQDDLCMRLLNLFDLNLSQDSLSDILDLVIRSKSLNLFYAFLNLPQNAEVTDLQIKSLLKKYDPNANCNSVFISCVESRNLELLNFFLTIGKEYEDFFSLSTVKRALKVAVDSNYTDVFDTIEMWLQSIARDEGKILIDIEKLHYDIENGDFNEVKKFSETYPDQRLSYARIGVCALEHAIDCKQFEIYAYLRANGFYTENGDILEEKIKSLSRVHKREICNFNLKYIKDHPQSFIGILLSKCKFEVLSPIASKEVFKMIAKLGKVDNLKPLLQNASQADIKIIFDFKTESVKTIDPTVDEHVMGIIYIHKGEVYVGRDQRKILRYGTFVHELSHLVFYLLYDNDALPYCRDDKIKKERFEEIIQIERTKKIQNSNDMEEIVKWVFYYDDDIQKAELAVRPNHIRARYHDDAEGLRIAESHHPELFDFYDNYVLQDIQIPNVFQLVKFNKDFGVIERIEDYHLDLKPTKNNEITNISSKKIILSSNIPMLVLKKLYTEINNSVENKLHTKVKNLFIDVDILNQKEIESEINNLITDDIERVIITFTDKTSLEAKINFIEDLKVNRTQIFIICDKITAQTLKANILHEYATINICFGIENLTNESKEKINARTIKFQDKEMKVKEFLDGEISPEIFKFLCSNDEIKINSTRRSDFLKAYIPRSIKSKKVNPKTKENEIQEDEFINSVIKDQNPVVLISDIAGSGKTTFLHKVHDVFLKKFQTQWISLVSFRDHANLLSHEKIEDFLELFKKMLKMSEVEQEIFTQKLDNGQVKIFFDGFDEIDSKICHANALQLIGIFSKNPKNQIWITTRVFLEHQLEHELNVKAFKLEVLDNNSRIQFLFDQWEGSLENKRFIEKCAVSVIFRISTMLADHPDLIGVPFIIQSVANIFKKPFREKTNNEVMHSRYILDKIVNLTILTIFEQIFEDFIKVMNFRFPERADKNTGKQTSLIRAHQYFAVKNFETLKQLVPKLGLTYDSQEWPLEDFACFGIIDFDKDKNVTFNHLTYAEYLLASYTFDVLKTRALTDAHSELLDKILTEEAFKIPRMFLDEMLDKFEIEHPNIIANSNNFCKFLSNFIGDKNILGFASAECLPNIIKFLMMILSKNAEFFKKVTLYQNEEGLTFLMCSLIKGTIEERLLLTFEVVKKNLPKSLMYELINCTDNLGRTVLFFLAAKPSQKIIECMLALIKNCLKEMSKSEKVFFNKLDNHRNSVLHIVAQYAQTKDIFKIFWDTLTEKSGDKQKYLLRKDKNENTLLHNVLRKNKNTEICFYVLELADKFCDQKTLKSLMLSKNAEKSCVLSLAVAFAPKCSLEKVLQTFQSIELKKILLTTKGEKNRNLISLLTQNKDQESINFMWDKFESNLDGKEIKNLINETDENGDNLLHCAVSSASSIEIIDTFWQKIKLHTIRQGEKISDFIKKKGQSNRNILLMSIHASNTTTFTYILENCFKYTSDEVFIDMIKERDSKKQNIYHHIGRYGTIEMLEYFKCIEANNIREIKTTLLGDAIHKFASKCYPIYFAAEDNTLDVFNNFVSLYEEHFDTNERKEIFKELEKHAGRNKQKESMLNAVKEILEVINHDKE